MVSRLTFALVFSIGLAAAASEPQVSEYDLKAAFLINFARYVEWPPEAFHDPADPMTICVLGRDPFGRALDDLAAGKSIDGRVLAVRRIPDVKSSGACRVLFVASSERKPTTAVAVAPPEAGVLTVGEVGNPVSEGMVINFTMESGRVRFTVDMGAAERQKVHLSSRLLGLASSVKR